jgi:hypothetical protein
MDTAIAESLGYVKIHRTRNYPTSWGSGSKPFAHPVNTMINFMFLQNTDYYRKGWSDDPSATFDLTTFPNYSTSLDEMALVETRALSNQLLTLAYLENLYNLAGSGAIWTPFGDRYKTGCEFEFEWVTATAAQRAEAYLKTIGKWEEAQ